MGLCSWIMKCIQVYHSSKRSSIAKLVEATSHKKYCNVFVYSVGEITKWHSCWGLSICCSAIYHIGIWQNNSRCVIYCFVIGSLHVTWDTFQACVNVSMIVGLQTTFHWKLMECQHILCSHKKLWNIFTTNSTQLIEPSIFQNTDLL